MLFFSRSPRPPGLFHAVLVNICITLLLLGRVCAAVASTVTLTASTVTISATPSPSSADTHTYTSDSEFKKTMLSSQNMYRSEHSAPRLSWNETLAKTAQKWANKCLWKHSGYGDGENLAEGFANTTLAVKAWADERNEYNYNKPGFSEKTGHFTQLVWAATTTVGCGRKLCAGGSGDKADGWIVVCEYWPPGNVAGEYQQNVHKQSSKSSNNVQGGESGAGSRGVSWAGLVIGLAAMMLMNQ